MSTEYENTWVDLLKSAKAFLDACTEAVQAFTGKIIEESDEDDGASQHPSD